MYQVMVYNDKNVNITEYSSKIVCSVEKENIFGTQFQSGLNLIKNFLDL